MTSFSRRVSFNNIFLDYIDPKEVDRSPFKADYSLDYETQQRKSKADQYFNDVNRLYLNGTYNALPSTPFAPKKKIKLPDPPLRSILKNKLLESQRNYNLNNSQTCETINYHGDLNELVTNPHAPDNVDLDDNAIMDSSDEEDADDAINGNRRGSSGSSSPELKAVSTPPLRRKLYSGLTDEELMALDPQFNTLKPKNNLDMFKFDLQKTYYLQPASRKSSTTTSATNGANVNGAQVYPTSNEENYKLISLTVQLNESIVAAREVLSNSSALNPDFQHRTLLTIISGRKHSWNSIDWLTVLDFLQPDDNLVIAALIPSKIIEDQNKRNAKRRSSTSKYHKDFDSILYKKCENLLNYVVDVAPKSFPLRVTVEFILDNFADPIPTSKVLTGNKFMFLKLFSRYQPQLVILGTKLTSLNFKYPLKIRQKRGSSLTGQLGMLKRTLITPLLKQNPPQAQQKGVNDTYLIKMGSYLIKYAPVPVILIGNHCKDVERSRSTETSREASSNPSYDVSFQDQERKNLSGSLQSLTKLISSNENEDIAEYQPNQLVEKPKKTEDSSSSSSSSKILADQINNLMKSNDENRFLDMFTMISDVLYKELKAYLDQMNLLQQQELKTSSAPLIKFDVSANISNTKIHLIYTLSKVSSRNEDPIYKVKLMILYDEDEVTKPKKLEKVKLNISTSSLGNKVEAKTTSSLAPKKKGSFWKKILNK